MWTRVELKERAKAALHRNYWRIVLVASLLFLLGCGSGGYQVYKSAHNAGTNNNADETYLEEAGQEQVADEMQGLTAAEENTDIEEAWIEETESEPEAEHYEVSFMEYVVVGTVSVVIFTIIFAAASTVILAVNIFLINPLSVGGSRFMVKSVEDAAKVKEIAYGFDHSYKNVVKVLFFKELYVFCGRCC